MLFGTGTAHNSPASLEVLYRPYVSALLGFIQSKGLVSAIRVTNNSVEFRTSYKVFEKLLHLIKTHLITKAECLIDVVVYESITKTTSNLKNHPASSDVKYTLIYNLLSFTFNLRYSVYVEVKARFNLNSISDVYPNANWAEREVFDMFGLVFSKHPDLRRILTDYAFKTSPMLKSFPLKGFYETYYSDKLGRVSFKQKVDALYGFRSFFIKNP